MQFFYFLRTYARGQFKIRRNLIRLRCSLRKTEVTIINNKLTGREKDFCSCFLSTGSAEKAARKAGYSRNSEQAGEKLLDRQDIIAEIARIARQREKLLANMASAGYTHLAFGSISDAISLLYMDKPTKSELENMDLFLVSEIKHPKDGAMEIKFFDRLKALEKLEGRGTEDDGVKSLFDAISNSAKTVGSDKTED